MRSQRRKQCRVTEYRTCPWPETATGSLNMPAHHPSLTAASNPILVLTALFCLWLCRGSGDQVQTESERPQGRGLPMLVQDRPPHRRAQRQPDPGADRTVSRTLARGPPEPCGGIRGERYSVLPHRVLVRAIYLLKEGNTEPPYLQRQFSRWLARFPLDAVNASHGGNYTCYISAFSNALLWSLPSTPLHVQVTGVFDPPSLLAQPGPLVQSGDPVTLRCHSRKFSIFALIKGDTPQHSLHGQPSPDFPLGPVSGSHGGKYRCYGGHSLDTLWSEPSAPLDILVAGTEMGSSPELWALPESHVPTGEDAMLQC